MKFGQEKTPPPLSFDDNQKKDKEPKPETGEKKEREKELIPRLENLIQVISEKPKLRVTTELTPAERMGMLMQGRDPEQEWFYSRDRRKFFGRGDKKGRVQEHVHVPKTIIESTENVAKGKAAHEAGHAAITRHAEFVPDEVLQELGFHAVFAATEERPTDQVVRDRYEGAGSWVDEARRDSLQQGLTAETPMQNAPLFSQVCGLITYHPHLDEEQCAKYSPEALATYEEIREDIEEIERTIPPEHSTESAIVRSAKKRYADVYRKVWPKLKKLVQKDVQEQSLQQLLENIIEGLQRPKKSTEQNKEQGVEQNGEQGGEQSTEHDREQESEQEAGKEKGESSGGAEGKEKGEGESEGKPEKKNPLDDLTEEEHEKIEGLIEKIAEELEKEAQKKAEKDADTDEDGADKTGEEKEGGDSGEEGTDGEEAGESTETSADQSGKKTSHASGKKPEGTSQALQDPEASVEEEGKGEEAEKGEERAGSERGTDGKAQEGTDAMRETLERLLSELPKNIRKELERRAREVLEKIEDEIVKELSGKFSDEPEETHEEYKKRKELDEEWEERQEERRRAREELEGLDLTEAVAVKGGGEIYEDVYTKVRELDEKLYRRLEEVFIPQTKRTMRLANAGSRLNLPAVFKWKGSRSAGAVAIDNKIFERTYIPEKRDYAVLLLVDLSGSMQTRDKIGRTFEAVVLLCEVLNRIGIQYEVLGFQDELILFKEFEQMLTNATREKLAGMVLEVKGRNPGGRNKANYNDDGPCLEEASERLAKQPQREKILIALSDGLPDGRRSDRQDLHDAVEKITKRGEEKLVGVGIGPGTEHVKEFYPVSLPSVNLQHFPEALGDLLEDLIVNPQKYRTTGS